ncbi:hypothetical protein ACMFMG_001970 [Clarireedia jacksonii]
MASAWLSPNSRIRSASQERIFRNIRNDSSQSDIASLNDASARDIYDSMAKESAGRLEADVTSSTSTYQSHNSRGRPATRFQNHRTQADISIASSTGPQEIRRNSASTQHATISTQSELSALWNPDATDEEVFCSTQLEIERQERKKNRVPEIRDTAKKCGRWTPRREPMAPLTTSYLDTAFPDFTSGSIREQTNSIEADRSKIEDQTPCRGSGSKSKLPERLNSSSGLNPTPLAESVQAANATKRIVKTAPYDMHNAPTGNAKDNSLTFNLSQHSDAHNTFRSQNEKKARKDALVDKLFQKIEHNNTFLEHNERKARKDPVADKENILPRQRPHTTTKATNYVSNASRTVNGQRRTLSELHAQIDECSESSLNMARHSELRAGPSTSTYAANNTLTVSTSAPNPTQSSFLLPEMAGLTELVNGNYKDTTQTGKPASRFSNTAYQSSSAAKNIEVIGKIPMPEEEKEIYFSIELLQQRISQLEITNAAFEKQYKELQAKNQHQQTIIDSHSPQNVRRDSATEDSRCVDEGHKKLAEDLKNANAQIDAYERTITEQNMQIELVSNERDTAINERDEAINERDEANNERNTAIKQREGAIRQRDEAIRQQKEAVKQRNEITKQRNTATYERDEAYQQLESAAEQRKHIVKQLGKAADDHHQTTYERDEARKHLAEASDQRDETADRYNEILEAFKEMKVKNDDLLVEQRKLQQQIQDHKVQVHYSEEHYKKEIKNLQREKTEFQSELTKAAQRNKEVDVEIDFDGDVTMRPCEDPKAALRKITVNLKTQLAKLEKEYQGKATDYLKLDKEVNGKHRRGVKKQLDASLAELDKMAELVYSLKDIACSL